MTLDTNGTNCIILGEKDISSIEEDSADEENVAELDDADKIKENDCDDNSNENFNEDSNEDNVKDDNCNEENENNIGNDSQDMRKFPSTPGRLKCSYCKCLQKNNTAPTALVSCSNPKCSKETMQDALMTS